jgi:hypothetical protein
MAVKFSNAAGHPAVYGKLTSTILNRAIEQGKAKDDYALLYKYFGELVDSFEEPIKVGGK